MPQAVTIENVGQAFVGSKEMQAEGLVWGDDCRSLGAWRWRGCSRSG